MKLIIEFVGMCLFFLALYALSMIVWAWTQPMPQ